MRTVILGEPLIHLASVDSTNNYAGELLLNKPVSEGTVILADHQTHGKGQAGNQWISEAGNNLLFSIILKPDMIMAERQFYLSMCISNALADFVADFAGPVHIKWPNDILLNCKKIAGILIENTVVGDMLSTSVIGVGLNVNQQIFPGGLPNPISLRLFTGMPYNLSELLRQLLSLINNQVNLLYDQHFAPIKIAYLNRLWGLNQWLPFSDSQGSFHGRIADVTDSGEVIVTRKDGKTQHYAFKEITFT